MVIGVDAFGGDYCPQIPIKAAVAAVNQHISKIALVGDETIIAAELKKHRFESGMIDIIHAPEKIDMTDMVLKAMRTKRNSSLAIGFKEHKEGRLSGFVSAGHSGAMLALGKFYLKTIADIERPCFSALMPSFEPNKNLLLLDAGANMDCKPIHLFQFAVLGHVYMKYMWNVSSPKIALLNVGEEEGKGDSLSKEAYELLKLSKLNFIGNIEGKDFYEGKADVIVCDGFAGNILLKSSQGTYRLIRHLIDDKMKDSMLMKLGFMMMYKALQSIKSRIDYSNYGGAPLLGLRGNGVVCHGSSNVNAILTGIKFAKWAAENNLVEKMETKLVTEMQNLGDSSYQLDAQVNG